MGLGCRSRSLREAVHLAGEEQGKGGAGGRLAEVPGGHWRSRRPPGRELQGLGALTFGLGKM